MADLLEQLKAALADRYRIERELGSAGMATRRGPDAPQQGRGEGWWLRLIMEWLPDARLFA